MRRVVVALVVICAAFCAWAEKLALYDIVPYSPGSEEVAAADILRTHETAGIDTFLYCVTLDPRGKPAFDAVETATASYRKLRTLLDGKDVRLGFLLQSILGHWPRVDKEIEPWQRSVDEDGAVKRFCIRDPRYQDYIRKTAAALAAEHPCFILGDDDIRAFSHRLECFCPLHTAEFNRRAGISFTPEQYRAAAKSCREGDVVAKTCAQLRDEIPLTTVRLIREGIDSVNPAIPAGVCMPGSEQLLSLARAKILAGKGNPVTLRFANGLYREMNRDEFISNSLRTQALIAIYGGDVDVMLDESDTFPHTLYARSGRTFVSKLALAVFNGLRGAKLWFVGMHKETERVPEIYERELGRNLRQLEAMASALNGSTPLGVRIPAFRSSVPLHAGDPGFFADRTWPEQMLGVYGIPFHADFSRAPGGVTMLCGEGTLNRLGADGIRSVLDGKAFVDGPTALALAQRGFADRLGCRPVADEVAFNEEYVPQLKCSPPITKTGKAPRLTDLSPKARVMSELGYRLAGRREPVATGSLVYESAPGAAVFVASYDPSFYAIVQNLRRKAWLVNALRTLDPAFPPVCENAEPNLTLARRGKDGCVYTITLNTGYDEMSSVRYSVPSALSAAPEVLGEDGVWRSLPVIRSNDDVTITVNVPVMSIVIVRWP